MLNTPNRNYFFELSIFPTTFTDEAASQIWDLPSENSKEVLGQFLIFNLVEWNYSNHRYYLHDIIRDYITKSKYPLSEEIQLRFANYYHGIAVKVGSNYAKGGNNIYKALQLFDIEFINIKKAQKIAASRIKTNSEMAFLATDFAAATNPIILTRLSSKAYIEWHKTGLQVSEEGGVFQRSVLHLSAIGTAYANISEIENALVYYQKTYTTALENKLFTESINALNNIGTIYHAKGDLATAIDQYGLAVSLAKSIHYEYEIEDIYGNLGSVYLDLSDYRQALNYSIKALVIIDGKKQLQNKGQILGIIGKSHSMLGNFNLAKRYYEEAIKITKSIGDEHGEMQIFYNFGTFYVNNEQYDEALSNFTQALLIAETIDDQNFKNRVQIAKNLTEIKLGGTSGSFK